MNKIKDIIYNKSDILIAILILAIAALIIFWRLGIILEYPKQILGTDDASAVLTEPETTDDASTGEVATNDAATENTDTEVKTDDKATTDSNSEGEGDTDDAVTVTSEAKWDGDKLAADLQVTLTGTTAYEAVDCLVKAGVFADYDEYDKICGDIGYDDEKMKAGVFTFAKGSTKEDIIKAVNWS